MHPEKLPCMGRAVSAITLPPVKCSLRVHFDPFGYVCDACLNRILVYLVGEIIHAVCGDKRCQLLMYHCWKCDSLFSVQILREIPEPFVKLAVHATRLMHPVYHNTVYNVTVEPAFFMCPLFAETVGCEYSLSHYFSKQKKPKFGASE